MEGVEKFLEVNGPWALVGLLLWFLARLTLRDEKSTGELWAEVISANERAAKAVNGVAKALAAYGDAAKCEHEKQREALRDLDNDVQEALRGINALLKRRTRQKTGG